MQILAGQGTPIVVFSGFEDELVRQEALRIGAAEFIVKGKVSPEALAQVLVQAAHQQHH
jgi:DNA-binding NarL/FixJ family response regulator